MKNFAKKVSFRLSEAQWSDLKRIEKHLVFLTRSALLKQALRLLSAKYPDTEKAKKESPLFADKKPVKRPGGKAKRSDKKKMSDKK
jgi:Arc/MetJ-type ribon-helix-helix transcriptional regulator